MPAIQTINIILEVEVYISNKATSTSFIYFPENAITFFWEVKIKGVNTGKDEEKVFIY